ncbi:hypothetical protein DY000_02040626 [Brassica cretica]|uniref:Uncharacterized protein n=1 Tax=Brassica cretica TaxID=69181 RepID=A0ABQ7BQS0_BRACR|nr:hypothetical protein DY000_02040626 [Brassica cretica]
MHLPSLKGGGSLSIKRIWEERNVKPGGELNVTTGMSLLDFSMTRSFPAEVDSTVHNDQGTLSLVKASGGGTKIRKTGGGGGGGKTDVRYKYRQSVQAPRAKLFFVRETLHAAVSVAARMVHGYAYSVYECYKIVVKDGPEQLRF